MLPLQCVHLDLPSCFGHARVSSNVSSNFLWSLRRNFGVCTLFLRIHPKLKRFLCPNLGKEGLHLNSVFTFTKKRVFTQKWSGFCVRNSVKTKKKVFSLNWSGFCAREVYCLSYYCNFMINNSTSVQLYVCAQ